METLWKKERNGVMFFASKRTWHVLREDLDAYHCIDFKNKRVLDVGGYIGETAVLFHEWGAQCVAIVEPVEENWPIIEANMKLHSIRNVLFKAGICGGREYKFEDIPYERLNTCFGAPTKNPSGVRTIELMPLYDVLAVSGPFDVAKFDCEGAELHLLKIPVDLLRKAEDYLVECHTPETAYELNLYFQTAGYEARQLKPGRVSLWHWHRGPL